MIKPSDISVSAEPADRNPSQRIRAGLRMTMERFTVSDGRVEVEREQEQCREKIWHELYGDISKEVNELERAVMTLLTIGGYDPVSKSFQKLRAMLRFEQEAQA